MLSELLLACCRFCFCLRTRRRFSLLELALVIISQSSLLVVIVEVVGVVVVVVAAGRRRQRQRRRRRRNNFGIAHCACGSHCNSRTIDGSLFAPSMNSSRLSLPSLLRSIWRNILSVRFSGVLSSSGIFITEPTIL